MPAPSPHPLFEPLAPLGHPLHSLTTTATHLVLGLVLGLLAAHIMRRCHLHWSWAACVFVPVVLAEGLLPGLTSTFGVAALGAGLRGRRWHGEDLHAGADLADVARARLTPLDTLRTAAPRLTARRAEGEQTGRLVVGHDHRSHSVSIPLNDPFGGTHTLVVGATGSGKTVTQTWIAANAVRRGMAVVAIDPKGDRALHDELARAARIAGRPFLAWTPQGPSVYNPFAHGTPTEIADKALAGERFTEPHYLRQAQRYLGHELRTLNGAGLQPSLAALVRHLDPQCLELLARTLPNPGEAQRVHDYLGSLTPRQLGDLSGVRDRLAILAEADIARWLDPATIDAPTFDLLHAVHAGAVVYFDLRSDQRPLLAQMLGAAIVQDLLTTVARLQSQRTPLPSLAIVDEFSALAAEQIARLFGRARSAHMSLLLGTQELSDLRLPGQERLQEQILGNLTTLIAHRQVVPDSAELLARLIGTRGAWRTSLGSGGRDTRTRVREHIVEPHRIARLPRGHAAVVALSGDASVARIARMCSPRR